MIIFLKNIGTVVIIYEIFPTLPAQLITTMEKLKKIKPTESELEILTVLWDKQAATVRQVHEILQQHKDCGYTTTLKLMQIMFEKELVTRDSSSKTHIYKPGINKEKTQKQLVHKMVSSLFAGSTTELVLQALGSQKNTAEELQKIENYIKSLKEK